MVPAVQEYNSNTEVAQDSHNPGVVNLDSDIFS